MATTFRFDPDRIAHLEANGWRAYYDRDWLTLLRLVLALCQEQFRIPFPLSLLAAYYVTRASAAWAPVDHDEQVVQAYFEKFYHLARRFSGLRFDPARVAALELQYNDVHRRLAGNPDKTSFVQTMTDLHAAIFGLSPEQARESAEWRVQANNTVDQITGKTSTDVEGDWARLEDYLRRCYRSIEQQLGAAGGLNATTNASNDYHFITEWRVEGTVEEVSAILGSTTDLTRWWPAVYLDVREIVPGDERGIGRVVDLHTKGWLPYTLRWLFRVTESRYPLGYSLEASGDFVGTGVWTFAQDGPWVNVTYDWRIRANKPLLRYLSFAMKPIFAANHRWAMAKGEESLRLELARRRAATPEARALVPDPPGPTPPASAVLRIGSAIAAAGLAYVVARRAVAVRSDGVRRKRGVRPA